MFKYTFLRFKKHVLNLAITVMKKKKRRVFFQIYLITSTIFKTVQVDYYYCVIYKKYIIKENDSVNVDNA